MNTMSQQRRTVSSFNTRFRLLRLSKQKNCSLDVSSARESFRARPEANSVLILDKKLCGCAPRNHGIRASPETSFKIKFSLSPPFSTLRPSSTSNRTAMSSPLHHTPSQDEKYHDESYNEDKATAPGSLKSVSELTDPSGGNNTMRTVDYRLLIILGALCKLSIHFLRFVGRRNLFPV